jgi:transposase
VKPYKCECGTDLVNSKQIFYDRRQVFDIPISKYEVLEYRRYVTTCPGCKQVVKGKYPDQITSPTQYGANLKSFCILANVEYKVPYNKLSAMVEVLYGLQVSAGTLVNFTNRCYQLLEPVENEIKQNLSLTKIAHVDETGLMVQLCLHWMHVMSNEKFTYLRVHEKRGGGAFDELLLQYKGKLIHDFFKSYFGLTNSSHNPCGSHITRELDSLIEDQSNWAQKFKTFYYELYHEKELVNRQNKVNIFKRFDRIIANGIKEEPKPVRNGIRGQMKKSKGLNLLLRLQKYKREVLEFAFDAKIPFTNNQAERDLRHAKIKLKVSGCFRSIDGSRWYARIMSVISTLKKHSINVFDTLHNIFIGRKFTFTT